MFDLQGLVHACTCCKYCLCTGSSVYTNHHCTCALNYYKKSYMSFKLLCKNLFVARRSLQFYPSIQNCGLVMTIVVFASVEIAGIEGE